MITESQTVAIVVCASVLLVLIIVYFLNKYYISDKGVKYYDSLVECEWCEKHTIVDGIPKGVSVKDFVLKEKSECDYCGKILKGNDRMIRVICTNCNEDGKRKISDDVAIDVFLSEEKCNNCGLKTLVID